jgi:hypothetical protein
MADEGSRIFSRLYVSTSNQFFYWDSFCGISEIFFQYSPNGTRIPPKNLIWNSVVNQGSSYNVLWHISD